MTVEVDAPKKKKKVLWKIKEVLFPSLQRFFRLKIPFVVWYLYMLFFFAMAEELCLQPKQPGCLVSDPRQGSLYHVFPNKEVNNYNMYFW